MNTDQQKSLIRKQIRELKKQLTPAFKQLEADAVFSAIEKMESFIKAQTIMAYWAMDDELPTIGFIEKWCQHKTIILPSVDGNNLRLKKYKGTEHLVAGDRYAIPEPNGPDFTDTDSIGFVVVPGTAFDSKNNRMGRGKAYYDQLLSSLKCFKAGVGFSFQLIEHVPVDRHDIPMNIVVAGKVVTHITNF